jgi:lipopolysaccharide/colanic/teichoic acid biosynthesis glycosyltransferase
MQRCFDLVFSGVALAILSPLFVVLAVVLKFSGEGEIFFFQERVGKNNTIIKLFKFATMLKNSENIGTGTVTLHNDPRILPLGGFLRKTKINELPQLLNILFGDMSIIGPRPQTQRCFEGFPNDSKEVITTVRPGLSGLGSIVFRDEETLMVNQEDADEFYDDIIMPYKGLLEEWYVGNKSIRVYFTLIAVTIWTVFSPKSQMLWRTYPSLPRPPEILIAPLNYP